MTGVFAPDCDCDAMQEIAKRPVAVRRLATDLEACKRFISLVSGVPAPGLGSEAVHGPSGHLLNVI